MKGRKRRFLAARRLSHHQWKLTPTRNVWTRVRALTSFRLSTT
jgi:hypothetical protein